MGEFEDMMDMGFEEVKPKKKRKKSPPKKSLEQTHEVSLPIATEVAKSITDANKSVAAMMAEQNKVMKEELNKLVTAMKPRPTRMKVSVHRNSAGFMDSLDIDLEY